MECKICLKNFSQSNKPIVLFCGHTTCEICFSHLIVSSHKCPFDRRPIKIANQNYQLMSYINSISTIRIFNFSSSLLSLPITCPSNHILCLTENNKKCIIRCNECCELFSSSSWHCSSCNYDLCHNCKGDILCCQGHVLVKSMLKKFRCDGCLKVFKSEAWACDECDVDICVVCVEKLKAMNTKDNRCEKGHLMRWRSNINKLNLAMFNKPHYECISCHKKFDKIGSLSCIDCKIYKCISCS